MKNTFNNLIEKCKNFWDIIQQNRKIKYAVIAGLVGVVIITLGIFTALGIKESADIPSDVTGGPAISEYDDVTVIQIGDDESDTDTEDATSGEPGESESDSDSAEDDTGETSSDDETGDRTEDTEGVSSDNEDTSVGDDPTPAGPSNSNQGSSDQPDNTPSKNTQGTTNNTVNTQSTTKPPVTTQSTTKPPVTTQSTTKPAETTPNATKPVVTTAPSTTTNPEETPEGFVVKKKKYDYNGGNVMILDVTNNTSKNYTITITGIYKDASGNVLKTENKTFEGYPAGYQNYFVFNPGIKFDSFSFELTGKDYTRKTYANYIEFGGKVECSVGMMTVDENGKLFIPTGIEEFERCREVVTVMISYSPIQNNYSMPLEYDADVVLFDNNGTLCFIGNKRSGNFTGGEADVPYYPTEILWTDRDKFKLPQNLKTVTGIMAFTSVTEY